MPCLVESWVCGFERRRIKHCHFGVSLRVPHRGCADQLRLALPSGLSHLLQPRLIVQRPSFQIKIGRDQPGSRRRVFAAHQGIKAAAQAEQILPGLN
jgi:hypothetical protein